MKVMITILCININVPMNTALKFDTKADANVDMKPKYGHMQAVKDSNFVLQMSDTDQWRIQDFPDGWGTTPDVGWKPIILQDFCQKLHENGSNWDRGSAPRLDSPMQIGQPKCYVSTWHFLRLISEQLNLHSQDSVTTSRFSSIKITDNNVKSKLGHKYTPVYKLFPLHNYRPQTKFSEGYVFTRVCHSVHRVEYLGRYTPGQVHPRGGTSTGQVVHPRAGSPPRHSACWDTVNKRAVRIPLECILVFSV